LDSLSLSRVQRLSLSLSRVQRLWYEPAGFIDVWGEGDIIVVRLITQSSRVTPYTLVYMYQHCGRHCCVHPGGSPKHTTCTEKGYC